MALPTIHSTGDMGYETSSDGWEDCMEIPGSSVVNHVTIINEGDWAGWWRFADDEGNATPPVRLAAGAGEPGERRHGVVIPTPGLSGVKLQVRRSLMGGPLVGIHAYATK
jgi:hypothetical protein